MANKLDILGTAAAIAKGMGVTFKEMMSPTVTENYPDEPPKFEERFRGVHVPPFQGKPACVRIALGRGVCGTAAAERRTIVVRDVEEFPGHIACDAASRSEIVIPLIAGGELVGVLDIDSPNLARFDEADARGLERLAAIFLQNV